jgi:hypothetical protein
LYRTSDSFDSRNHELNSLANGDAGQADRTNEAAYRGVELGYRIVDKHIREGRSAAQRHQRTSGTSRTADSGGITETDTERIIERTFRAISDLLPLWRELLNSIAAASFLRMSSMSPNAGAPAHNARAEECSVAVELTSPRPTRVTVALQRGYDRRSLVVRGLHAIDPHKPSITDVDFLPALSGERACLRIRLSENQPPGVYAGIVADKESEEPCGTLTIRIK